MFGIKKVVIPENSILYSEEDIGIKKYVLEYAESKTSNQNIILVNGDDKIDDIRDKFDILGYKTEHNEDIYFIINDAEKLSQKSICLLLKILEEPPINLKFILTTTNIYKINSAIKSRCKLIHMDVNKDEIITYVEHMLNINNTENDFNDFLITVLNTYPKIKEFEEQQLEDKYEIYFKAINIQNKMGKKDISIISSLIPDDSIEGYLNAYKCYRRSKENNIIDEILFKTLLKIEKGYDKKIVFEIFLYNVCINNLKGLM